MHVLRAGSAVVLACAPVLLAAPAAHAATETQQVLTVDASAWSWRTDVPAGLPATEPSNVPAGGLAVEYDGRPGAAPAKATYLRLALGEVPHGAVALGLTLVLPVDDKASTAAFENGSSSPLVACALKGPFQTGEGVDPAKQPAEDCASAPHGVYDPVAKSMSFALSGLANTWLSGAANHGLVVRPDPAAAVPTVAPFQLTLLGAKAIKGLLTAQLPGAVAPTPVTEPAPQQPQQPAPPVGVPSSGFGSPPGFGSAPAPAPGPEVLAPQPVVNQPVALVGAPQLQVVQLRPRWGASQAGLAAVSTLGLLLLALVGWSLGEGASPWAYARAERRCRDRLARGPLELPAEAQPKQIRQGRKPRTSATSTVTYS